MLHVFCGARHAFAVCLSCSLPPQIQDTACINCGSYVRKLRGPRCFWTFVQNAAHNDRGCSTLSCSSYLYRQQQRGPYGVSDPLAMVAIPLYMHQYSGTPLRAIRQPFTLPYIWDTCKSSTFSAPADFPLLVLCCLMYVVLWEVGLIIYLEGVPWLNTT